MSKLAISTALSCLIILALSAHSYANYYVICKNDGICEKHMCVADLSNIRGKCQQYCGYYAVVTNIGDSNCSVNASLPDWKHEKYKQIEKLQQDTFKPLGLEPGKE